MTRARLLSWAKPLVGLAVVAALVWKLGAAPFVEGISQLDAVSVVVAMLVNVAATVCCAWRWHLVAEGLGVDLPRRRAFTAYYRSQFLNATLPGGVVGDVERAVRHGRDAGDVSGGLRSVWWERVVGLVVQLALTAVLLLVVPSPLHPSTTTVVIVALVVAVLLGGGVAVFRYARSGAVPAGSRRDRVLGTAVDDIRHGVLARERWWLIVLLSALVLAAHLTIFLIAAHAAAGLAPVTALPLGLVVLAASTIPFSFAGWGPREGVAAWVFGAAGLGAAAGVATSAAYGVLVLLVTLPGGVILLAGRFVDGRGRRSGAQGQNVDKASEHDAVPTGSVPAVREVAVDG